MYLRWHSNFGVVDPSEWVIDFHRTKHGTYIPNWNPLHHASWKQPFKKNSKAIAQPNHWPINQRTTTKSIKQNKPNKKNKKNEELSTLDHPQKHRKKNRHSNVGGHDTTMMTEASQGKIELHTFWGDFVEGGGDPKSEMLGFLISKRPGVCEKRNVYIPKSYIIRILPDHFWKKWIYNPLPILDPWDEAYIYLLIYH